MFQLMKSLHWRMSEMKSWIPVVVIGGFMFLGIGLVKLFLIPDLPLDMVVAMGGGTVTGLAFVLGISKVKQIRKKNNVPEVDERTWTNIKNYYAVSLYFVVFGSMLLVCILFALGIESIELGAVSLYLLLIFMILVVGTHIVRRQ